MVDLIKVGHFIKKEKYSFCMKSCLSELVSKRGSNVLTIPLQLGFPGLAFLLYCSICDEEKSLITLPTG